MAIRIISVIKNENKHENPYLSIDYLEWMNEHLGIRGLISRTQIYDWIKEAQGNVYVLNEFGIKRYLTTAVCLNGNKYVKTDKDDIETDYLLKLPECS